MGLGAASGHAAAAAPANVPSLKDDQTTQKLTMPNAWNCIGPSGLVRLCHRQMDALGFALDNFDGIGSWRDTTGPVRRRSDLRYLRMVLHSTARPACGRFW